MFVWTDENTARLRELHSKGLSFSQIAGELGCPSRNAAIGKAGRIGLRRGHAGNKRQLTPGKPKPAKPKPNSVSAKPVSPKPPKPTVIAYEPTPPAQDVARVLSVLYLENGMCRWPVEHASGMGFCGCDALEGRSYCGGHHARSIDRRPPYTGRPTYSHPSLRAFG